MERAVNPDTQSTVGEVYLDDIVGVDEFIAGSAEEVTRHQGHQRRHARDHDQGADRLLPRQADVPDRVRRRPARGHRLDLLRGRGLDAEPERHGPVQDEGIRSRRAHRARGEHAFYLDPKPSLQQVTYLLAGGSSLVMYENDEIDISGVGVNDVERIRDPNEPLNEEYRTGANMSTDYIGFNTEEPPFDDPDIRRAFAMATDRELVSETVLMDILLPAKGVLPPGIDGYDENFEGVPFDPEGGRAIIEEKGGADLFRDVTLLTSGQGAAPSEALAAVTALWEENLGVTIAIEQEEFGIFLATSTRATSRCSRSAGSPTTRTRRISSKSSCTRRARTTRRSTRTPTSMRFSTRPRRRRTRPSASASTRRPSS